MVVLLPGRKIYPPYTVMRMAVPAPQRVTGLPAPITCTEEIEENMTRRDATTDYDVLICYNMLFGESESSWDISWSFIDKSLSGNKIIQSIVPLPAGLAGPTTRNVAENPATQARPGHCA